MKNGLLIVVDFCLNTVLLSYSWSFWTYVRFTSCRYHLSLLSNRLGYWLDSNLSCLCPVIQPAFPMYSIHAHLLSVSSHFIDCPVFFGAKWSSSFLWSLFMTFCYDSWTWLFFTCFIFPIACLSSVLELKLELWAFSFSCFAFLVSH